ncbi:MAG: ATP-binding protein, partial [Acidimicrobiia bacterium]
RYTFNSIRDYLTRVSHAQPRLFILEDLHWADEPTLLLVEHLAERLPSIACLIVATHRDAPSDLTPQLTDTLSRLVRGRHAHRLTLTRHNEGEVEGLLQALSGQNPPAAIRSAIHAETDGNVFFVEEVFRHLVESGRLLDEHGRFRTDVTIGELDVPANVRLVLDRRLDRFDEATRQALGVAAVAGRHLSFDLWEAICDLDSDDLIDAIDEAERAGVIVTEHRAEQEEYWFGHELIRQTVLTRVPAPRRRRYHLRVADTMERLFTDDLAAQAGTIAAHLLEAGSTADPARLFRYLVLAAQRSLVSAAFRDALRHLRRAASLAEHVAGPERADMLFHLGIAERGDGHPEAAVDAWSRAIDLSEAHGDASTIRRISLLAAFSLGTAGRYPDAYAIAQRGLAALGDRAADEGGPLLAISGFIVAFAGDYEQGMRWITQALDNGERLGDAVAAGHALTWKAAVHHVHMESLDTVESGLRAADMLRGTGELWQLATALGVVAFNAPALGRLADARRATEVARPLADRLGAHITRMHCDRSLALVHWFETGDLDTLESFARRDMQLCLDAGLAWVSWSWSWLGLAAFLRGDWDTALDHAAKAVELSPPGVINGAEAALHLEYLAYAGHRHEAMATIAA